MQKLYELQYQLEVLKAKQNQAADAELIQQQAARYKNTQNKPKPSWI